MPSQTTRQPALSSYDALQSYPSEGWYTWYTPQEQEWPTSRRYTSPPEVEDHPGNITFSYTGTIPKPPNRRVRTHKKSPSVLKCLLHKSRNRCPFNEELGWLCGENACEISLDQHVE